MFHWNAGMAHPVAHCMADPGRLTPGINDRRWVPRVSQSRRTFTWRSLSHAHLGCCYRRLCSHISRKEEFGRCSVADRRITYRPAVVLSFIDLIIVFKQIDRNTHLWSVFVVENAMLVKHNSCMLYLLLFWLIHDTTIKFTYDYGRETVW